MDRFAGWHPNAIAAYKRKGSKLAQARRKEYSKTADGRRREYQRLAALSAVELIDSVGQLGGGDDYDGCFTRAGENAFRFAKRCLRQRVRCLESERDAALEDAKAAKAEAKELHVENERMQNEISDLRDTLADWYEFGPPTDHSRKKATAMRDALAAANSEKAQLAAEAAELRAVVIQLSEDCGVALRQRDALASESSKNAALRAKHNGLVQLCRELIEAYWKDDPASGCVAFDAIEDYLKQAADDTTN